jgi:hypothetical protein
VLLIIESDILLAFESSLEDIKVPEYKDGKYFLHHSKGSFALSFEGKVFGKYDKASILFGS